MLEVASLTKRFGEILAVDDLSFSVGEGEIVAMLGPNGAGKTTTVRMITGLLAADSGSIRYQDRNSNIHGAVPPAELGYLPEERGLYVDRTVLDGLVYFARLRGMERGTAEAAAKQWLERLDLGARANDEVKTLSKGNQQKVQVISAVLHQPRMAILDEPFSGFDPVNQEKMLAVIGELRDNGTTVILSAHQMDLVERLAERIILLSRGRIVRSGSTAEILDQSATDNPVLVRMSAPIDGDLPDGVHRDPQDLRLLHFSNLDANDAIEQALGLGQISSVSRGRASLHQVYLQAVQEAEQ